MRCACLLFLCGCFGTLTNPQRPPTTTAAEAEGAAASAEDAAQPLTFACDPDAAPAVTPLRRLSARQYKNAIAAFVSEFFATPAPVLAELEPFLAQLPQDAHDRTFSRMDQALGQQHVDTYYAVARRIGELLVWSDSLASFIDKAGRLTARRALTSEEVAYYAELTDVLDVATVMLSSPDFLYALEGRGAEVSTDVLALTSDELATRLALHLWQGPPDAELLAADLLDAATYDAQVGRLLADPRAHAAFGEFLDDWLDLHHVPDLSTQLSDPAFAALAGADLPQRENMIEEVHALFEYYLYNGGELSDVLTSRLSFAKSPDLAAIYGVPVWTSGAPPEFSDGKRSGLLTRAAMLATAGTRTAPIHKGVFIRRNLLCDPPPPPPANATMNLPEIPADVTSRERAELLTERPGSSCAGCHVAMNPFGFATEGFDPLGRVRTNERIFSGATELESRPIDLATDISFAGAPVTPIDDAATMSELLGDSDAFAMCATRQMFRYTFARDEDAGADGCSLETLRQDAKGASLMTMVRRVTSLPQFKQQRLGSM